MGYTKYLVSGCITQGHSTHDPGYRYRAKRHQGRFHISSNKKHMLHPACNGIQFIWLQKIEYFAVQYWIQIHKYATNINDPLHYKSE